MKNEQQYLDVLKDIIDNGFDGDDRTGTGTLSVFARQMRFDLQEGFPLLTTKKVHWKSVVEELLWLLSGSTSNTILNSRGVTIWDEWAREDGDLGRVYGAQWRDWRGSDGKSYDQIKIIIDRIKNNPTCRRIIVSAWNPAELDQMALPPCHAFFQFNVQGNKLSCQLYQRSCDFGLGVPFNIASYALLTHLVANECGLEVGEFIHSSGNAHVYRDHIEPCKLQLSREPLIAPRIKINIPQGELLNFIDSYRKYSYKEIKDFIELIDYKYHSPIKMDVSV